MMMMMMMMMMMNFFSSNQDAWDTLQDDLLIHYHDIRQGIYHNFTQNDDVRAFLKETYGENGSEAAGNRKVNGFQLKSFRKASILSAGPGRERPGIEKPSIFN